MSQIQHVKKRTNHKRKSNIVLTSWSSSLHGLTFGLYRKYEVNVSTLGNTHLHLNGSPLAWLPFRSSVLHGLFQTSRFFEPVNLNHQMPDLIHQIHLGGIFLSLPHGWRARHGTGIAFQPYSIWWSMGHGIHLLTETTSFYRSFASLVTFCMESEILEPFLPLLMFFFECLIWRIQLNKFWQSAYFQRLS